MRLLRLMGGDAAIVALGLQYARIFLLFTPFFMCNYIVSAFARNDGDPSLAMVATLSGSLFNVVFDYIFIFPMGWGLPGAALATAISPVISISICSLHFRKPTNGVAVRASARLRRGCWLQSCQLGISGFVGEMSSAVTTHRLQPAAPAAGGQCGCGGLWRGGELCAGGNGHLQRRRPGRAAAGEPVLRQERDRAGARKLLGLGSGTALALAAAAVSGIVFGFTDALVAIFNSENSALMARYAFTGMRIYFIGYLLCRF